MARTRKPIVQTDEDRVWWEAFYDVLATVDVDIAEAVLYDTTAQLVVMAIRVTRTSPKYAAAFFLMTPQDVDAITTAADRCPTCCVSFREAVASDDCPVPEQHNEPAVER